MDHALKCGRTITRRTARLAAVAMLGTLGAACAVDDLQLSTGPGTGFASDQRPTALAGAWVSSSYVRTPVGLHAHEIVWEFRPDGFAVRTNSIRNITTGLADTEMIVGRWSIQGQFITVQLDPPHSGTLRLRYSVHGDLLLLDSQEFHRIW